MASALRWLFACLALVSILDADGGTYHIVDPITISSPGYPHGYFNYTNQEYLYNLTVDPGYGVVFLFKRFALGPNDYFFVCPTDGTGCIIRIGADNQYPFIYYQKQTANIVLYSINTDRYYAGFQAEVRRIPLNDDKKYFQCNQTVDLSTRVSASPFFLVSQNYLAQGPAKIGNCFVNFKAAGKRVKVVVDDYFSFSTDNRVTLTGKSIDNKDTNVNLFNIDGPRAYYFNGDVNFVMDTATTQYRFFLYVETYDMVPTLRSCDGTGTFDFGKNKTFTFQSNNFDENYLAEQYCSWKYTNIPPNGQVLIEMQTDFEYCCDSLLVNGAGSNGALTVRGHNEYTFQFSSKKDLSFEFTSDELEQYMGFRGSLQVLDCDCKHLNINLTEADNNWQLVSPGYLQQKTYCENIDCQWNVVYPKTHVLYINPVTVDIFDKDTITITDSQNGALDPYYYAYGTTGKTSFHFTTLQKSEFNNSNVDSLKAGFQYALMAVKTNITYITVDLCDGKTSAAFDSRFAPGIYDAVIYTFMTTSCNKPIRIHHFFTRELQRSFTFSIIDGPLETGVPVNYEFYIPSSAKSSISNLRSQIATVKLVRILNRDIATIAKEAYGLATAVPNDGSCELTVRATNMPSTYEYAPQKNEECIQTFFYDFQYKNDYNGVVPSVSTGVQSLKMYKGVETTQDRMIIGPNGEQPNFVYGPFLTITTSKPYSLALSPSLQYAAYTIEFSTTAGVFMTSDFGGGYYNFNGQTIILNTKDREHVIKVKMMKSLVEDEMVIVQKSYPDRNYTTEVYTAKDGAFQISAPASYITLTYTSKAVYPDGGILATYSQGEKFTKSVSELNFLSTFLLVAFIALNF